jgi:hypothetical protein
VLIAVTGLPGASKTQLLAALAAEKPHTEGFLAVAHGRAATGIGAQAYRLRLLATGEELPWCERDDSLAPPYRFEPETMVRLRVWAAALKPQPPLLLLDEFGKFESRGEGLMPLWPEIVRARPGIAVLAVRAGVEAGIEQQLGRRFDLRIEASAPDALAQLRRACADYGEWTQLGLVGGASGALEMSLGSALHAAKIPFRGTAMSSLQAAMMVFAGRGLAQPGRVVWVPFISAGLKALSPAGNRLRPMIAIVTQGLLFGGAVQLGGWRAPVVVLGGALVGAWAAAQGFFLQWLMLGDELVQAYDSAVLWLAKTFHLAAPSLPWVVGAWTATSSLVAATVTLVAWRLRAPPAALQRIIDRAPPVTAKPAPGWRARGREFTRWQFWLPLLLVSAIMLAGGRSWASIGWLALRFFAVGCVLMALVSLLRPAGWPAFLRARGWWGPAVALSGAFARGAPQKSSPKSSFSRE